MKFLMSLFAVVLAVFMLSLPAAAQFMMPGSSTAEEDLSGLLDAPLTEAEANALMSRLSDEQVREVLLGQMALRAATADSGDDAEVSDFVYHATTGAASTVTTAFKRLPLLFEKQAEAFSTFAAKYGSEGILRFAALFLVVLAIAAAVRRKCRFMPL